MLLDAMTAIARETWAVLLEAAPWLLLGLLAAGLIRALISEARLTRLMGGSGMGGVLKAAVLGTPLPLCSCGVLPAAIGLRRQGLSRPGTVSFLVATPQNGVDSIAITYALLGPVFAVFKVVAGVGSAVAAGAATLLVDRSADGDATRKPAAGTPAPSCCHDGARAMPAELAAEHADDAAVSLAVAEQPRGASVVPHIAGPASACCVDEAPPPTCCASEAASSAAAGASPADMPLVTRLIEGQRYAFGRLFADIALWLAIGLVLAGAIGAFVSPEQIGGWGSGFGAMLAVLAVSVPLYVCATASVPVAAALVAAGVSPGTALVFLIAGPATNIAGLVLIRRELGSAATAAYLAGLILTSVGFGLATDAIIGATELSIAEHAGHAGHVLPPWLSVLSAATLAALFAHWATRAMFARFAEPDADPDADTRRAEPTGGACASHA